MKLPVVVVDANQIVVRDWRVEKPASEVLRGLAATGQLTLVVPELVVRECVGRFRQKAAHDAGDKHAPDGEGNGAAGDQ